MRAPSPQKGQKGRIVIDTEMIGAPPNHTYNFQIYRSDEMTLPRIEAVLKVVMLNLRERIEREDAAFREDVAFEEAVAARLAAGLRAPDTDA